MSPTFVRVSVFREDVQLDVSIPAQRPVIEVLDDIVALLGQHGSRGHSAHVGQSSELDGPDASVASRQSIVDIDDAHTWVLSSPSTGIIEAEETLASHGVMDGARLYLTSRVEAAHSPFVDDVMAALRSAIDDSQWRWSGAMRSGGFAVVSVLVLVSVLLGAAASLVASPPWAQWEGFERAGAIAALVSGVLCALWAGLAPLRWQRWLACAFPVAVGVVLWHALKSISSPGHVLWTACGVCCAVAVASFLVGRRAGGDSGITGSTSALSSPSSSSPSARGLAGMVTGVLVALLAAIAALAWHFGASVLAFAAWTSWLPVLVLLVAPSVALSTTGLPTLLRRSEAGDAVEKARIARAAVRSEAVTRALVWTATVYAVAVILVLLSGPYWQQGLVAALLSLILLLRTNGFADARLIAPLVLSGLVGVSLSAGAFVSWGAHDWARHDGLELLHVQQMSFAAWVTMLSVGVALAIAVGILQRWDPDELAQARVAKVVSVADAVLCLVLIPVILIGQGVFFYLWATT